VERVPIEADDPVTAEGEARWATSVPVLVAITELLGVTLAVKLVADLELERELEERVDLDTDVVVTVEALEVETTGGCGAGEEPSGTKRM
jgi:hypothetical protein